MFDDISSRLKFFTDHFLVLSLTGAIVGSSLSYTYIYSYLSGFDPVFIDFVEYTDMTKIAITFGMGALAFFYGFILNFPDLGPFRHLLWKFTALYIAALILGAIAFTGFLFLGYYYLVHKSAGLAFVDAVLIPLCGLSLTIYFSFIHYKAKTSTQIALLLGFVLSGAYLLGAKQAIDLRFGEQIRYDIFMKQEKSSVSYYLGAKIIFSLSHHMMFLLGDRPIVVQTPDVAVIRQKMPISH